MRSGSQPDRSNFSTYENSGQQNGQENRDSHMEGENSFHWILMIDIKPKVDQVGYPTV
jgi:hypothetical protein